MLRIASLKKFPLRTTLIMNNHDLDCNEANPLIVFGFRYGKDSRKAKKAEENDPTTSSKGVRSISVEWQDRKCVCVPVANLVRFLSFPPASSAFRLGISSSRSHTCTRHPIQ